MQEAKVLADFIAGQRNLTDFKKVFSGQYSAGFDPERDLQRIGVVNQTTMLASDTQSIADFLKKKILERYQQEDQVADTRDTLCYATLDNQTAVTGMLQTQADLALVVGGYNSSNTSHLVELCEEKLPTYFISHAEKIISDTTIVHFDLHTKQERTSTSFLPTHRPLNILITSGASCPDAMVEAVIEQLLKISGTDATTESVAHQFAL
jgi:4-hydroxy-3-methylbut-2-enyl diphosphate reductase